MRIADYVTARLTSGSLVLVLLVSMSAVALPAAQETDTVQGREGAHPAAQSTGPISAQPNGEQLPDSPGAQQLKTIDKDKAAGWSEAPESSPEPQPRGKRKPVGTAAAEISNTTGFAAARPAGVGRRMCVSAWATSASTCRESSRCTFSNLVAGSSCSPQ